MRVSGKGVSTALASMVIILLLIMAMVWMSYVVTLNARQQARLAEQAETAALKAKELIRVYIWLDPVKQPDGSYLNLTRISFVGEWSGETTINGLLVVWRNGLVENKPVSIRLAAGEDRTYTPSQLGIAGIDDYREALARLRYIQAHTSLGNDFVSIWGRPDKPALYVMGTTRTDTYTTTRTTTSIAATTTTRTATSTSYTTTQTIITVRESSPYASVSYDPCRYVLYITFRANGWGTPPYSIVVYEGYHVIGSATTTSGSWTGEAGPIFGNNYWSLVVTDAWGRQAIWSGLTSGYCTWNQGTTTGGGGGTTTSTISPTTSVTTINPGTTTVWITETVTSTHLTGTGSIMSTITRTITSTRYVTVTSTTTSTAYVRTTMTSTYPATCQHIATVTNYKNVLGCGADDPSIALVVAGYEQQRKYVSENQPLLSLLLFAGLAMVDFSSSNRLRKARKAMVYALALALLAMLVIYSTPLPAKAEVVYSTTTITVWTTITNTNYSYFTKYTTVTTTNTLTTWTTVTTTSTSTSTTTITRCVTTVTVTLGCNIGPGTDTGCPAQSPVRCECGLPSGCLIAC